ncbi:ester hydrolase C11orf54-like [Megaptera novaeangliae]
MAVRGPTGPRAPDRVEHVDGLRHGHQGSLLKPASAKAKGRGSTLKGGPLECGVPEFGVLQKGLTDTFADVQVSVVDCPNLTKEPFTFPVKGICGKTRIAEVGGVPYLLPLTNKKKVYDLNKIAKEIQLLGAFVLGAGAGPFQTLGFNSEFMPVVQTESEHKLPVNGSYFAHVNAADGGCLLEKYSEKYHDLGFALLANLFASEGQPGKPAEFSSFPLNSDALSH